mgnify:CR=1 FL=1
MSSGAFQSRARLAVVVNEGSFHCNLTLWKQAQESRLKTPLIRFGLGGNCTPPLSGIDSSTAGLE